VSVSKHPVEVAYALPDRQLIMRLEVETGTTVAEAVELSQIWLQFPELEGVELTLGVFGRKRPPDYVLRSGDRVEIYRPLIADPKEVRRQRAEEKSTQDDSSVAASPTRSEASGK
jgi:putative ubiquitin-RnfH superfamily antitoxin RatB of RatAB toxin-antitoxin module